MRGIIFRTAKAAFRKAYRKHKAEKKRQKIHKGVPVVPYSLVKSDIKRKIRGTKFTAAAEFKAQPGLKRRIRIGIEKAKREKKKFRKPVILGKAYASDKKGKTMQIQPLTILQRRLMKKEMAKSADREYKRVRLRKFGYNTGGMKTVKMVKNKLEKASAAHAGQAKALGKVIDKKKMLVGGLLTKGIKAAYKAYRKTGRKTSDAVKKGKTTRSIAKSDVKSGIRDQLKSKYKKVNKDFESDKSNFLIRRRRLMTIKDLNLLK